MKRKTHIFLVAVDEDPEPGFFDKDMIFQNLTDVLNVNVGIYNPQIAHLVATERDSNFLTPTLFTVNLGEVKHTFHYEAAQPELED